ncbi:fimbrillin family protein [Segatella paludivivens]|uniref:fimbrillin family protein n=1 Tax=Segatella paludivivens TaxID=185294 RepID=UPI0003A2B048|nr:fimbrillin family protein [Segatella paludivivens]
MGKKFLRGINVSLLLLIVISLFCSCTGEMNAIDGNNNKQINFSVSAHQWKNTDSLATTKTSRAAPITDNSFGIDKSFRLLADQNDGASNYSTLIDKESVSFTNNIWQTTPSHYYWSGIANKTISFYAYYPSTISNVSHTAGFSPILSYTVPDNVPDQIDIITAINPNIPGNTVTSTSLTFNHIFAAIQFSVGSNGIGSGTISSISIGNVANSGTYTFGGGWSNVTGSKTFTILQSKTIAGTSGEDIYSGNYTLMMIPQIINNVTITITYSNGSSLTKTISETWEAGKTYNYKISYSPRTFDYTGNIQMYTVPVTGTYKLEVYGAQGGGANNNTIAGGQGGYSYGNIKLKKGTTLYIVIGGAGSSYNGNSGGLGGYNGGGNGGNGSTDIIATGGSGGGGATHISVFDRGTLNNYSSTQDEILIVAGGGGGYSNVFINLENGSTGGGINGGSATANDYNHSVNGGTQNNGYAFGKGQQGASKSIWKGAGAEGNGGGGGGWYGGYAYQETGENSCCYGAGGSGHLSSSLISSTTGMTNGVRSGNGYAKITFISAD